MVNLYQNLGDMNNNQYNIFYRKKLYLWPIPVISLILSLLFHCGCKNPSTYRKQMDETIDEIIAEKQLAATGQENDFTIDRPSDILRRRLIEAQSLPVAGDASFGTDQLDPIAHWPEGDYPAITEINAVIYESLEPIVEMTLMEALQIGARNSFEYQSQKEDVFRSALDLELQRDVFRNTYFGQLENSISTNTTGSRTESGNVASGEAGVNRTLQSGAQISTALAIDLANLLTMNNVSSLGIAGDATVSVPLLRGAGRHIVTEPLIQAERNTIYAIWTFERFKKEFAVDVARRYLSVLQQLDSIKNNEADYRSRVASVRRSRRLADAGMLKEIEVDQAVQNDLRARQRWIASIQSYKRQLDAFKTFLGLTPDARIKLDPNELTLLAKPAQEMIEQASGDDQDKGEGSPPAADDPIHLDPPDDQNTGPYEFDESVAIRIAFENRLDLRTQEGQVYDAQRKVVVAADALGAELTFFGSADLGARRTVRTADLDDAQLRTDKGVYSALLTLDLPFERTQESVNYRNSFITLERVVRNFQTLEDNIKTQIRNLLRDMLEARENLYIQAKAVSVAQKRVRSVNMFLEAGRANTRDLLEAQDALLAAQNALTAAVVDYRIAELNIQRDMGVLQINEKGLWKEYIPGEPFDVEKEDHTDF